MDAKKLTDIVAGDEVVIIQHKARGADNIERKTVDRVTMAQIISGPLRFWKRDGQEVGGPYYGGQRAEPYDPEKHDPMFAALKAERERNAAMGRVLDQVWRLLSTDQLRRIVAILDEGHP